MSRSPVLTGTALGAMIVISATLALSVDSAGVTKSQIYTGHLAVKSERVRLAVKLRHGEPRAVSFEAKNVLLFCDDGTERTVDVGPLRIPMRTRVAFSRTIVRGQRAADRTYIGVDGMLAGERARGVFYYYSDPWDPPGEPYAADCSAARGHDSGGWTARRR